MSWPVGSTGSYIFSFFQPFILDVVYLIFLQVQVVMIFLFKRPKCNGISWRLSSSCIPFKCADTLFLFTCIPIIYKWIVRKNVGLFDWSHWICRYTWIYCRFWSVYISYTGWRTIGRLPISSIFVMCFCTYCTWLCSICEVNLNKYSEYRFN